MRETAEKKTDEIRMLNEVPGRFNASPVVTSVVRIRKERLSARGYGVCAHFSRLVPFLVTGYLPGRSAAGRCFRLRLENIWPACVENIGW